MVDIALRGVTIPRRDDKAPEAFRTISEVASELDVPAHVLRFWEGKFKEIKPLKRGGGRRYYRPEDVDILRSIRNLLYSQGFTIRGAQKHLRESHGRLMPPPVPTKEPAAEVEASTASEKSKRRNDDLTVLQRRRLKAAVDELEAVRRLLSPRR
ncbi:MAG: MerR family transcriptional regulator [Alphaproteobacteria bacterium]|nr:MerR family transcriptional regulator [Alphaproteobacteria bacterium]